MFGLRDNFLFVSGGEVGILKADQLGGLLREGKIDHTAVMIGDRAVDILAARKNGLTSVGILWGYGNLDELQEVSPDRILKQPEEIGELVNIHKGRAMTSQG